MARLIRVNFGLREIDTFLNRRLGGALMQFVGWYVHWILNNFEFAFKFKLFLLLQFHEYLSF